MIIEAVSILAMGGVLGWTLVESNGLSEGKKISKIANNCGLYKNDENGKQTLHLLRKRRREWGVEYVYRIPLGLSFEDFLSKKKNFEDGLNVRRGIVDLRWEDIRALKFDNTLLDQIEKLNRGKRKELVMDYDGCLILRVYNEPLTKMLEFNEATLKACKGWKILVGVARENLVYHDFEKSPHLISAGTTQYGKSVFLKNIVTTLIHNNPDTVRITLLDLKGGLAFQRFKNCRQVRDVAKDTDESMGALQRIEREMKKVQAKFLEGGFENVEEAKYPVREFIIVDEAAELSSHKVEHKEDRKKKIECERILSEIARIGGSLGYRLVYATQYPTADVLPRQIKQNVVARMCFVLGSEIGSMVVLDEKGAESLPLIKGRAIYKTDRKYVVQSPYIDNSFIDKTIQPHITIKAREGKKVEPKKREASGRDTIIFEDA
jgi:hypothetical protein